MIIIVKSLGNIVCDNLREHEMCGESRTNNLMEKRIKQSITCTNRAACNPLSPRNNETSRPFRTILPHAFYLRAVCLY